MNSELPNGVLRALFVVLKPLARALLRTGVGYREFSDVAKAAFIHEASNEFGLRGRPTNISRVAIMTGISRKEVSRLRIRNIEEILAQPITETPYSVVLSRWSTDPRYIDSSGNPKVLHYDGGTDSFVALVSELSGDIPAGAMKVELKRVGAVHELPDKRLALAKRHFVPTDSDQRLTIGLLDIVAASLSTIAYNCDSNNKNPPRFQRVASIDDVPTNLLPFISAEANARLGDLAISFDDFLVNICKTDSPGQTAMLSGVQAGIGLFYYERDLD